MSVDPQSLGAKCHSCPLKGKKPVFGQAPRGPVRFVIVGEAPGYAEELKGVPFVGRSGKLLDRVLRQAGLSRGEAFVTNAMLCRPENDRPDEKLAAASCCAPRLAKELQTNGQGKFGDYYPILTLGRWPALVTTGARTILKSRGFVWTAPTIDEKKIKAARKILSRGPTRKRRQALYLLEARALLVGRTVIPSVHPAHILRGAEGMLAVLVIDLRRLRRLLKGKLKLEDAAPYTVASTPNEVIKQIRRLPGIAGVPGNCLSLDVETTGPDPFRDELLCVGVSNGINTVEIHPWLPSLAPALRLALMGRTIVTHYGPQFDQIVLKREKVW